MGSLAPPSDIEVNTIIVYSTPPSPEIFYPYIIVNASNRVTWAYIKREVDYLIIDSGVFKVFHEDARVEYPGGINIG